MTVLILAHGRKYGEPRCQPESAKNLDYSYSDVITIDNNPFMEPDLLYDLRSGERLPFQDEEVDLVIDTGGMGGMLEWFHKKAFWKEMHRVMKPTAESYGRVHGKRSACRSYLLAM